MSILYPKSRIVIELQREIPVCRTRSQQGLGQARPNKSTSETGKSLRSEVPDGQKVLRKDCSERQTSKGRTSPWRWYPAF